MNREFWNGKTVLVTGHTGFKGSWLASWLHRMGAHVIGYALRPTSEPNMFDAAKVGRNVTSVFGDIRNAKQLGETLAQYKPNIIFHLAAQPLVRTSYAEPVETFEVNVMGTVHLLEEARHIDSVQAIVVVTSDKCYENTDIGRLSESAPLGGRDPYSSSKACAELVVSSYRRSFFSDGDGPALATVRAGNVIGGGDWSKDRLIPDVVRSVFDGVPLKIRYPSAVRPWQHVLEPLGGYLHLAEKLWSRREYSEAWNFGPLSPQRMTVSDIVEYVSKRWGTPIDLAYDPESGALYEAPALLLDCSKVEKVLGWRSKLSVHMALDWAVDWYSAYYDGQDMESVTLKQIEHFERIVGMAKNGQL